MPTKIFPWVDSLPKAIAAGIMRSVSQFYILNITQKTVYLDKKLPNCPAEEIVKIGAFMIAAREAGKKMTACEQFTIPEVHGVPMRVAPKIIYDTFVPLLRKGEQVMKGETQIVAVWKELP